MIDPLEDWRALTRHPQAEASAPTPGFTDRVRQEARRRDRRCRQAWTAGVTGLVLLAIGIGLLVPGPSSPARHGHQWLLSQQNPDGSWDPGTRSLTRRDHRTGVTSLALLALLEDGRVDAEEAVAVEAATGWLLAHQSENGALAPPGHERLLVHGMASRALLRARDLGALTPEQASGTERAIRFIARCQQRSGGWSYDRPDDGYAYHREPPSTSASVWPLRALALEQDAAEAYARGIRWLENQQGPDGRLAYRPGNHAVPGATLMGALCLQEAGREPGATLPEAPEDDLYLAWFRDAVSPSEGWRSRLRERQEADGGWPADDRWSPAGGRVYATALALLALN